MKSLGLGNCWSEKAKRRYAVGEHYSRICQNFVYFFIYIKKGVVGDC